MPTEGSSAVKAEKSKAQNGQSQDLGLSTHTHSLTEWGGMEEWDCSLQKEGPGPTTSHREWGLGGRRQEGRHLGIAKSHQLHSAEMHQFQDPGLTDTTQQPAPGSEFSLGGRVGRGRPCGFPHPLGRRMWLHPAF